MNPLFDLRKLIAAGAPRLSGQVVEAIGGDRYRVRVQSGTVEAIASGSVAFIAGDDVMIREGVILGRLKSAANVKTYSI